MAFKSIDRSETITVVVSNDPAIDAEKSDFDKYRQDFDESHLCFIDGEEPTRFTLGTISYLKFQSIKDRFISFDIGDDGKQKIETNIFGLTSETLACSLKKVDNAPFDIKVVNNKVSDQCLDKLGRLGVVEELGNIALSINGFGESDEKKS